jgi:hypothetical protein
MEQPIADVLRARRIEVVDAEGVVRVAIHTDELGCYLELVTPNSDGHLILLSHDNGVGVQAWSKGNTAASGHVGLDGVSSVSVFDPVTEAVLFEATTEAA